MVTRILVLGKVDEMISLLSEEISQEEMKCGWTESSRSAMLNFFEELKDSLENNKTVKGLSISRGLDHWGITGGELMEKSAVISNELRLLED